MTAKTITLTGAEIRAGYSGGSNAWLRNDGADVIYAAAVPGITAGSDGVVSIPAGQSAPVYGAYGTVYLLGTGSVQLIGSDYSTNPFKTSAQSGGSGADSVARAAINQHAGNADIHVTAAEKSGWDALSNPNLLINYDFAVNQRGQSEYSTADEYTVDGWRLGRLADASVSNGLAVLGSGNGVKLSWTAADYGWLYQRTENPGAFIGKELTASAEITDADAPINVGIVAYTDSGYVVSTYGSTVSSGSGIATAHLTVPDGCKILEFRVLNDTHAANGSCTIKWCKLEVGGVATPFMPPDPAAELARCQRYYQIRSTNDIAPADLRPSMGTITDIKAVEGGYAYVAEL